jgi:hypothetical protein
MRWTFANEIAWKTMTSGSIEYPEGAVFAKIGAVTHDDAQFPSSAVPNGARRFQFMVRDKVKYASTGGWGYALFDVEGKVFPEPILETTMACYACHKIVQNRGQIFSQPFLLAGASNSLAEPTFLSKKDGFRIVKFGWQKASELPTRVRQQIPPEFKRIRVVNDAAITKYVFQGTLDEIRPRLELEAFSHQSPAALISKNSKHFSLIFPNPKPGCKENRSFKSIISLSENSKSSPDGSSGSELKVQEYCNP